MYGLMRAKNCGQQPEEKHRYRLHYCGTCKTMGSLYGQRARMLLNNDAVFFGELLTALSTEIAPVADWERAYQSYNCFAMPTEADRMPLSLQIAATATLVMSEFKVTDQIEDGGSKAWKLALRVYSEGFHKASAQLKEWGFPMEAMWKTGRQQESREAEAQADLTGRGTLDWLEYLAEPTAAVTGMVFEYGARTVGREAAAETMRELGFAFGQLVYLLDALEDYEKDARKQEFNALRTVFAVQEQALPDCYLEATEARLWECVRRIEASLRSLPIAPELTARMAARLRLNMDRKLGIETCATNTACATTNRQAGFKARWTAAVSLAKTLTTRERDAAPASLGKAIVAPFVFASVLTMALLAPKFALAATSYRECMEFSLNLMALGAIAGAILSAPARLVRPVFAFAGRGSGSGEGTLVSPSLQPGQKTSVVRKRRRPGWADGCNCGDANCWDCICCCESIDCCCDCASCCEGCSACGECGSCCNGCDCSC